MHTTRPKEATNKHLHGCVTKENAFSDLWETVTEQNMVDNIANTNGVHSAYIHLLGVTFFSQIVHEMVNFRQNALLNECPSHAEVSKHAKCKTPLLLPFIPVNLDYTICTTWKYLERTIVKHHDCKCGCSLLRSRNFWKWQESSQALLNQGNSFFTSCILHGCTHISKRCRIFLLARGMWVVFCTLFVPTRF